MKTLTEKILRSAAPALAAVLVAGLAAPALAMAQFPRTEPGPGAQVRLPAPVKAPFPQTEGSQGMQVRLIRPVKVVMSRMGGAYLGVQLLDITEELRAFYGAPPDAGVLVSRVAEDSPAAAAGFAVGDVITEVAGSGVARAGEVVRAVGRLDPEEEVTVEVVRGGAPRTLSATLAEREEGHWFGADLDAGHPGGLRYFDLGEVLREELREDGHEEREDLERAMRHAFEEARERMGAFDAGALSERLAEAEARLRELEKKLAEKER